MNHKESWRSVLRGRAIEELLGVILLALLVLITMGNVLVRYFTSESFAWTEEISVALLVMMSLAGASCAAAMDGHIRIDFLYVRGSEGRRRLLRGLSMLCVVLLFGALAVLIGRDTFQAFEDGETSQGLGVPRWWYGVLTPLLAAAVAVRALFHRPMVRPEEEALLHPEGESR